MIQQTKCQTPQNNFFSRLWNDFLFAREFEYETPLTPDEMSAALKVLENRQHRSWLLSFAKIEDTVEIERLSDKSSNFVIHAKEDEKSPWKMGFKFHQIEGTMTANPETGTTLIKGQTRFNSETYLTMLFLVFVNIFTLSLDFGLLGQLFWLGLAAIFWFGMYQERNAFADRLDDIIMHAKSERSIAALMGEEDDKVDNSDMLEANTVISNLGTKER